MSGFRGSDDLLDREIAAIERIARVRVRRVAAELKEFDRDLRELKRERARRRAADLGTASAGSEIERATAGP
ncbi:MAG TPA: hypothetical protein VMG99_02220 [Thermoplasmata archaeon]|nr:hypothetical protein [Thermoplasmata archaeon]